MWHWVNLKSMRKMERIQERAIRFLLNGNCASYKCMSSCSLSLELAHSTYAEQGLRPSKCINVLMESIRHSVRSVTASTVLETRMLFYYQTLILWHMEESLLDTICGSAHLWNNVPSYIKCAPTLKSFTDLIWLWSGPSCSCVLCKAPDVLKCTLKCFMTWISLICIYPLFRVEKWRRR